MPPERTLPLVRILGEVKKSLDRLVETISESQQSKSAQGKPETQTESKTVVRLPVEVTEYYRSAQSDRPKQNRRDRLRLRLEIIGVILASAIAVSTLCSLFIFNGQLKEMQRATEISERPWLSVEAAPVNGLVFVNGEQAVLKLNLSIKNVGKSIAKDVQTDAKMFPTAAGIPAGIDADKNQRELCDHPKLTQLGSLDLFPTDNPVEREMDISAIPSAIATQAVTYPGDNPRRFVGFYVVGCVSYHSSFGDKIHQTLFSYLLIGPPLTSPDGKLLTLPNGMPPIGFEVGVDVPQNNIRLMREFFSRNAAN
jgi:hypothetical protein